MYCAVITHDGQRKNGFAECMDDTMNPRGKGDYVAKTGGRGQRNLIKKIDMKG